MVCCRGEAPRRPASPRPLMQRLETPTAVQAWAFGVVGWPVPIIHHSWIQARFQGSMSGQCLVLCGWSKCGTASRAIVSSARVLGWNEVDSGTGGCWGRWWFQSMSLDWGVVTLSMGPGDWRAARVHCIPRWGAELAATINGSCRHPAVGSQCKLGAFSALCLLCACLPCAVPKLGPQYQNSIDTLARGTWVNWPIVAAQTALQHLLTLQHIRRT